MKTLTPLSLALLAATLLVVPTLVFGADDDGSSSPEDFRGKVTLAYGLVFAILITYLVLSHRRNASLWEDVDFLKRRVNEIEKK